MAALTPARADRPLRQESEQGKQGEGLVSQSSVIITTHQVIVTLSLGSSGAMVSWSHFSGLQKSKTPPSVQRCKTIHPAAYMRHREGARDP